MIGLLVPKLIAGVVALLTGGSAALGPVATLANADAASMGPAIEATPYVSITGVCDFDLSAYCRYSPISRGEVAAFLIRALGREADLAPYLGLYPDVPSDAWYAYDVELLSMLGMAQGYGDGNFRPEDPVSRAELAALIIRALGEEAAESGTRFVDVPDGGWYAGYVQRLAELGITQGCSVDPDRFCPSDWATRGEMEALLQRSFDLSPVVFEPRPASNSTSGTIWTGTQEDDWYSDAVSGNADIASVTHPVLGPAVKASNFDVDGSHNAGARINFQGFDDPSAASPIPHAGDRVMPTSAWYSADFFVPNYIGGQDNVFQFKQGDGSTRVHLWNVGWKPVDGTLRFIIRTRLNGSTWQSTPREIAVLGPVPVGRRFTIEVFRRISTGPDGRYEVRIDGQLVYEFDGPTIANNLQPRPAGNQEWVLSHYLGSWQGAVDPRDSSIFFTNARIRR